MMLWKSSCVGICFMGRRLPGEKLDHLILQILVSGKDICRKEVVWVKRKFSINTSLLSFLGLWRHPPPMLTHNPLAGRRSKEPEPDSRARPPSHSAEKGDLSVSFSNKLRVVLIPCRQEYRAYGIHLDLWWQAPDYLQFKNDVRNERFLRASQLQGPLKQSSSLLRSDQPFPPPALLSS